MRGLRKKLVAIAGATSGIGLATAKRLLKAGCRVVICSEQSPRQVKDLMTQLSKLGEVYYLQADFTKYKNAVKFVDDAFGLLGGLDILILNVGIYVREHFLKVTSGTFNRQLNANLKSAFFAAQRFVKLAGVRSAKNQGVILLTGSINGVLSEEKHTVYDLLKAAIAALTRSAAIDLAPCHYRVCSVEPGLIATTITDNGFEHDLETRTRMERAIPMQRIGHADEVAGAFAFLASSEASYITGVALPVNGGLSIVQTTAALDPLLIRI